MYMSTETLSKQDISTETILNDYYTVYLSRQLSILGKKEVLAGRATFGIFGDGKEVAQVAYAAQFRAGDWRSGYYRDQTFMMKTGLINAEDFFSQLYGLVDKYRFPLSTGRNFNNHYATSNIDTHGNWLPLKNMKNSTSDISPTSGQMPRLFGLAYGSKLFRENGSLHNFSNQSDIGNEVAFGTIGESGTSEGNFWETINAAGVLQVPMAVAVWDDNYGISVPVKLQTVKSSISKVLGGFIKEEKTNGILVFRAKGWDYPGLNKMFREGIAICRKEHVPVVFHIEEMTQPLGHSTSGSHARYKPESRIEWEKQHDPVDKMKEWILEDKIAGKEEVERIEEQATNEAREAKNVIWKRFSEPVLEKRNELTDLLEGHDMLREISDLKEFRELKQNPNPRYADLASTVRMIIYRLRHKRVSTQILDQWLGQIKETGRRLYNNNLYVESDHSALKVKEVKPVYHNQAELIPGREILNRNFRQLFWKYPLMVTFGEDTGKIGDVDQGMKGLQNVFGDLRVTDTGIRESTIIGQGIGLALRGFRPIAEIQYLDYLIYGLHTLSDDLATTHYRTAGRQVAPVIIRTRGHRLVGIWHSGSPLSMIINSVRGVYVCVPRNLTQAAGFYNTLMKASDPAIVIEPLKGYSMREPVPSNIGEFNVPLGVPEIISEGHHITLVTYGWCVQLASDAVQKLSETGISVELIDVQTLLPFDVNHVIRKSIEKTSNVLFLDEDVPGGATAFMMQKVIEEQQAFYFLDSPPRTLTAQEHRSAYTTDGDYFSKPSVEDIIDTVYEMMHDADPEQFPY